MSLVEDILKLLHLQDDHYGFHLGPTETRAAEGRSLAGLDVRGLVKPHFIPHHGRGGGLFDVPHRERFYIKSSALKTASPWADLCV